MGCARVCAQSVQMCMQRAAGVPWVLACLCALRTAVTEGGEYAAGALSRRAECAPGVM
jgi:hypothetical protein